MADRRDVIVIGGGAAGLMAAGRAAAMCADVLLLEKMEKVGRKIRITGKGRCNLTNDKDRAEFLSKVRSGADFAGQAFDSFSNGATVSFFEKIGLPLVKERGGRFFPASGDAWDVVRVLEKWCLAEGVEIRCGSDVDEVVAEKGVVKGVKVSGRMIEAPQVIIATGGFSYPSTGSTGDGHRFAHELGHTIVPVRPALVSFEIEGRGLPDRLLLKNIALLLWIDGLKHSEAQGEVEFFPFGIGGSTTYTLSRDAVDAVDDGCRVEFRLDLKPALSKEKLIGRIGRESEADAALTAAGLLRKLMPRELVQLVSERLIVRDNVRLSKLNETEISSIADTVKSVVLKVKDHRGFCDAVITAGGVSLDEVDASTMESLKVKGLFFAGEVLDIDAATGGYNLQLAFSTGNLAGCYKR